MKKHFIFLAVAVIWFINFTPFYAQEVDMTKYIEITSTLNPRKAFKMDIGSSDKFGIDFGDGKIVPYESNDSPKEINYILKGKVLKIYGSHINTLSVNGQKVTSMKIVGDPGLTNLDCSENEITELDVSSCKSLEDFSCYSNKLIKLVLDKENPTKLLTLNASDNQLSMIDLPNTIMLLSLSENKFSDLKIDHLYQLQLLKVTENNISKLKLPSTNYLQTLIVSYNPLESIDLSGTPNIDLFKCDACKLNSLDLQPISHSIRTLWCNGNKIENLDLSNCENLSVLYAANNKLKTLDLSKVSNITDLMVSFNSLEELNLGDNPVVYLFINYNNITKISPRSCPSVQYLDAGYNKLTSIDPSNQFPSCWYFDLTANPLTEFIATKECVKVMLGSTKLQKLNLKEAVDLRRLDASHTQIKSLNMPSNYDKLVGCNISGDTELSIQEIKQLIKGLPDISKTEDPQPSDDTYNWLKILDLTSIPNIKSSDYEPAIEKGWKVKFKETEGIDNLSTISKFTVEKVGEDMISIKNEIKNRTIYIYSINGKLMTVFAGSEKEKTIRLEPNNEYVITDGLNTTKIMM